MIDQSTIDKIFDSAEILQVVEEFVPLKKRGVNYLGLCPFHNEKTPSFTVSPSKGIYKCFGCGKGGNSVNFIMEYENLGYVEALKFLARKYHIEFEDKELSQEDIEKKNERESLLIVTEFAQKFFTEQLLNTDEGKAIGLSYFKERGFRDEIIEKFQLGYNPQKKEAFTEEALKKGYKLDFLVTSGLTIQKDDWKTDRFSGRIIFPVHDLSGKVIAFGARTLKDDKKSAKYLNSPESIIYYKSKVLYGIFYAKREILNSDNCFLVEGYTDVLSLYQSGIHNVVASSGTSLTEDQIRLIKRFTENITILYDGDEAGIKASLRGIDLILAAGMNVKVLLFPEGQDPDSYSRNNSPSVVKQFISDNQEDFIGFKTKLLKEETKNDPVKRSQMISDILRSISVIPDKIKRAVFIKESSINLNIGEEILYSEVTKLLRKESDKRNQETFSSTSSTEISNYRPQIVQPVSNKSSLFENEVIRILIKYGNNIITEADTLEEIKVAEYIIREFSNNTDAFVFENPINKTIFSIIEKQISINGEIDISTLIKHHDPEISSFLANILSHDYVLSDIWKRKDNYIESEEKKLDELVPETLYSFRNYRIEKLLTEFEEKLKGDQSEEDIIKTLQVIKNLKGINIMLNKKMGNRSIY